MQACPRLTKPTAKAGSSSVTLRNSVTAMSKCRSLSALRPASRCCIASGEDVCNASHRIRTVLITASPVPVFPEIDLLKQHQALDVFLKARIRQSWRIWRHPDRGTRSNRDGLGARVQVNGQTRLATTAGSYESANDKRLHLGLGAAKSAKIDVFWPSGTHQVLGAVSADQFLEIREPEKP